MSPIKLGFSGRGTVHFDPPNPETAPHEQVLAYAAVCGLWAHLDRMEEKKGSGSEFVLHHEQLLHRAVEHYLERWTVDHRWAS